jgi:hypothetical protein
MFRFLRLLGNECLLKGFGPALGGVFFFGVGAEFEGGEKGVDFARSDGEAAPSDARRPSRPSKDSQGVGEGKAFRMMEEFEGLARFFFEDRSAK